MTQQLLYQTLRTHQWIYEHTDGFLGHRLLLGNPTLLLRTTGRRTALPRTTALTYARAGDSYLIADSNGGWDQPPCGPHGRRAPTAKPRAAVTVTGSPPALPFPRTPTTPAGGSFSTPSTK